MDFTLIHSLIIAEIFLIHICLISVEIDIVSRLVRNNEALIRSAILLSPTKPRSYKYVTCKLLDRKRGI